MNDTNDWTIKQKEADSFLIFGREPKMQSLVFQVGTDVVGKLEWDKDGMRFTGNADEAARLLFDEVIRCYGKLGD